MFPVSINLAVKAAVSWEVSVVAEVGGVSIDHAFRFLCERFGAGLNLGAMM